MIPAARFFTTHCPSCSTGFPVDPGKVPEGGIAAICSDCRRVFTVVVPEGYSTAASADILGGSPREEPDLPAFTIEDEPVDTGGAAFEVDSEAAPLEIDSEAAPFATEEPGIEAPSLEVEAEDAADRPSLDIEPDVEPPAEVEHEEPADRLDAEPLPGAALLLDDELPDSPAAAAPPAATEDPPTKVPEPPPTSTPTADPGSTAPAPKAEPKPAAQPPETEPRPDPTYVDLSRLANEALADEAPAPPMAGKSATAGSQRFGKRDPHERAQHLARVLVSDIIACYPVRYQEALSKGTLAEDFANEIKKSFREFTDQVGAEMAESTPYFNQALNEVLARGKQVF